MGIFGFRYSRFVFLFSVWNLLILLCCVAMSCDAADGDAKRESPTVIIVGGGLAGLSAAITAASKGSRVVLIDGEKNLGGNSAKASSGINGCGTSTQKKMGIDDSFDSCYGDTVAAGDHENDPALVKLLVEKSSDVVEWLIKNGVDLTDVNLCGGHSVPRTHWVPSPKEGRPIPVGFEIIKRLKAALEKLKDVDNRDIKIMTETEVKRLNSRKDSSGNAIITGVHVMNKATSEESDIAGDSVILTTGGFSNDHTDNSLLMEFASEKMNFPTTNGPFAVGSGVKMARELGAQLIGMDKVQIHPTGFVDPKDPSAATKFLAAEALRGKGAILLNHEGSRFANELGRRDYLTEKIIENCTYDDAAKAHVAYMLLNEEAVQSFGPPAFMFYSKIKGFFQKYESLEDMVNAVGFDMKKLVETIARYNEASEAAHDDFGKKVIPVLYHAREVVYLGKVTPCLHYTMGGVKIDTKARVLSSDGSIIKGLYGAGEVTGGVHGSNRLAGNSLLECAVFGRIAGAEAVGQKGQFSEGKEAPKENDEL